MNSLVSTILAAMAAAWILSCSSLIPSLVELDKNMILKVKKLSKNQTKTMPFYGILG